VEQPFMTSPAIGVYNKHMATTVSPFYRAFLAAIGGLPLLFISWLLLRVWIDPVSIDGGAWLRTAATLVLLEILLLHSGAFMAAGPIVCPKFWQRLLWFSGFSIVYFGGMVTYANWSGGNYVLWLLLGVLASRLLSLVVLTDKKATIMMLQRSAIGVVVMIGTALVCFIPLPLLGITEDVRFSAFGRIDDLLSGYPERLIAWGIVYFFLMGIIELYMGWWLPNWRKEDVEKTWTELQK
jgi:hypothetical protein